MQLLEGELQGKVIEYQQEKAYINGLYEELKKLKKSIAEEQGEIHTLFCQMIERRKRQREILTEQGLLSKKEQKIDKNITKWLDERKWMLKEVDFQL